MKKKLLSFALALMMVLCLLPATAMAADTVSPSYGWYGDGSADEFTLATMADYLGFVRLTQGKGGESGSLTDYFSGKTVKLACDLDFSNVDFLYRDSENNVTSDWRVTYFYGTFDGQEHTLSNLTYTDAYTSGSCGMGVFKSTHGTIQNLNVDTVTVTADTKVAFGGIVYCAYKPGEALTGIYNCHVSNVTVTVNATSGCNGYIGGLAGFVHDNKEVKDCSVTNFKVTAKNAVLNLGGLIGRFYLSNSGYKTGALTDCDVKNFTADVAELAGRDAPYYSGDFGGIGGMLGYGHDGASNYAFPIEDCTVDGVNITVCKAYNHTFVGGFLGMSRRRYAAKNCTVTNGMLNVTSANETENCSVGGFCGAPTGAVIGDTGGWSQDSDNAAISFENCSAEVDIIAGGSCVAGGFAGVVGATFNANGGGTTHNTAAFIGCTASGTVVADNVAGAFAGQDGNRGDYNDCSAEDASVIAGSSSAVAGGFIGQDSHEDESHLTDCTSGTAYLPPAGESVVVDEDSNSVTIPAGSTVIGSDGTETTTTEDTTIYLNKTETDETSSNIPGWLLTGLLGSSTLNEQTFVDVSRGAYYYNAVEWAQNKGIAGGVDSKHFAPDESCTRAQAVTMMWRAAGCPDIYGANPFVDVDSDDYYYEAVLWAVAMGITSGTDENHFSPDEPCTRGQIVTFLHRAARCYQAHENYGFVDVKNGSYCEDAVNWAVSCVITNGTGVDTFSPDSVCTRAQIVTFLYRNR